MLALSRRKKTTVALLLFPTDGLFRRFLKLVPVSVFALTYNGAGWDRKEDKVKAMGHSRQMLN